MAESSTLREDAPAVGSSSKPDTTEATSSAPPTNTCESRNSTSAESDGTTGSTSGSETDIGLFEASEGVLRQLARQVEYYFSTANLSKDTYVETLRSLNDGYVPVSIIANFGKVRALVPYDSINAVHKAASDYSELLEVVMIDTQTGKKVLVNGETCDVKLTTLEAVGPISGKPIPVSDASALQSAALSLSPSTTSSPPVQNTVILREVPENVQEDQVRELFTFEKCPPVQSARLDVANCWFVTLDTSSREDMVQVMFELRTKQFASGEPVKARLKSGVVVTSDCPPLPLTLSGHYQHMQTASPHGRYLNNNGGRKSKNKKKNNGQARTKNSNNKGKNNNHRRNNGKNKKSGGQERPQHQQQRRSSSLSDATNGSNIIGRDGTPDIASRAENQPPSLGDEQFPALPTDDLAEPGANKIEVETVPQDRPEDDLEKIRGSDGASTATTSTSSSTSKQMVMGGYAAALLKAAPKPAEESSRQAKKDTTNKDAEKKKNSSKKNTIATADVTVVGMDNTRRGGEDTSAAPVVVTPPSWGGGRSFADVLKKEAAAAAAAAPEQSA